MDRPRKPRKDILACHDIDLVRRKREEDRVQLRKSRRTEHFSKRRLAVPTPPFEDLPGELLSAFPDLRIREISSHSKVTILLNFLKTTDPAPELVLPSIRFLRKGLSVEQDQKSPLTRMLVAGGIADILLRLLSAPELDILKEALWCVVNLTSEPTQITTEVAKPRTIARVVELTEHADKEVVENSVWTLGNLAGDSPEMKDYLLAMGVLPLVHKLGRQFSRMSLSARSVLLWLLGNLYRGDSDISKEAIFESVALLSALAGSDEPQILEEMVWTAQYISQTDPGALAIMEAGFVPRLVPQLEHANPKVVCGALRVVGNLVAAGTERHVDSILEAGFLSTLGKLTIAPPATLRREIVWLSSNVLMGPKKHKLAVLRDPLIDFILSSASENDFRVQDEVLFCLMNCLSDEDGEIAELLAASGVLDTVVSLLEVGRSEEIVLKALRVLDGVLLAGRGKRADEVNEMAVRWDELGGIGRLEKMQSHPSMKVYREAVRIMDAHFGIEEAADTDDFSPPEGEFEFS